jgi:TonB family protein
MRTREQGRRAVLAAGVAVMALGWAGCGEDGMLEDPEIITVDSPFKYPVAMWDDGVEGETVVMVRVTEMGGVDSVYVYESSGHAAFDSAAVAGARELRFAPGRRDDRRVTTWTRVPVRFLLEGENGTVPAPAGSLSSRAAPTDADGAQP